MAIRDHITVVKHMIAVQVVADKEGITPVVKGDGAGTEPDNDRYGRQNIIDGRKWLLSTFESAAIQALLAEQSTHAPGIWHYMLALSGTWDRSCLPSRTDSPGACFPLKLVLP